MASAARAACGRSDVASACCSPCSSSAPTSTRRPAARPATLLVQELLVNLMLVARAAGVHRARPGILSFGHLAFAQIAAYGAAIVADPRGDEGDQRCPTCRSGSATSSSARSARRSSASSSASPSARVVGIAVARAGGLAATMITLAVLFVVDQVGQELAGADARRRRAVRRPAARRPTRGCGWPPSARCSS